MRECWGWTERRSFPFIPVKVAVSTRFVSGAILSHINDPSSENYLCLHLYSLGVSHSSNAPRFPPSYVTVSYGCSYVKSTQSKSCTPGLSLLHVCLHYLLWSDITIAPFAFRRLSEARPYNQHIFRPTNQLRDNGRHSRCPPFFPSSTNPNCFLGILVTFRSPTALPPL